MDLQKLSPLYDLKTFDVEKGQEFLNDPEIQVFLIWLPGIVNALYGKPVPMSLETIKDPEVEDLWLFVINLYTDLPIDEEFDDKEDTLFRVINNQFETVLSKLVISQH